MDFDNLLRHQSGSFSCTFAASFPRYPQCFCYTCKQRLTYYPPPLPTLIHTHTDGSDYTAVTRTLTFTSTITSIPVPVRILDDMVYEDLEIFLATLNEASLERITVAPGAAIVNIADEDGESDFLRLAMIHIFFALCSYHNWFC